MGFPRPCLDCGALTKNTTRCDLHQSEYRAKIDARRQPYRTHYKGNYSKRSKEVRANAEICWICKEGRRTDDPFTADHYFPGIPNSPLLPAHRSCNSRRKNTPPPEL